MLDGTKCFKEWSWTFLLGYGENCQSPTDGQPGSFVNVGAGILAKFYRPNVSLFRFIIVIYEYLSIFFLLENF